MSTLTPKQVARISLGLNIAYLGAIITTGFMKFSYETGISYFLVFPAIGFITLFCSNFLWKRSIKNNAAFFNVKLWGTWLTVGYLALSVSVMIYAFVIITFRVSDYSAISLPLFLLGGFIGNELSELMLLRRT